MGKRGPKPSFVDVPCPNKGCDDYGKIGNENVVGNGTYKTKNGTVHKSTAEILNVKLDTVRRWLRISSKHCGEVNQVLMKDIDVDKVELDELWTFVKKNVSEHGLPIRKMKDGST
ncbi:MAG: hypothetical protein LBR15_00050 [Methanobrevibacter sp.]|jgi:hypothetical protein|nr:hypothetical protein [Candidatus Methanovirga australis]